MSFPPEFYLIGAQKSGTTTLAHLLSQHLNVCISQPKEPHFFTHNWSRGLGWYQNKFCKQGQVVCIDASASYSMALLSKQENASHAKQCFQGVPERVFSINPSARFIYLLRDPVERTYSGYWHNFMAGREHKDFDRAVRDNSFYLDVSNYFGQLNLWLKYFPIESFLFLLFENMKENPEQVTNNCFQFLGLNSEGVRVHLDKARNSTEYVSSVGRWFNKAFKNLDRSSLGYVAPTSLRKLVHRVTVDHNRNIPRLQERSRVFLQEYFFEKNRSLERLTGLPLKQWQAS